MAFRRIPSSPEEEDEEEDETDLYYPLIDSVEETLTDKSCRFCGSLMFKGVIVLYRGEHFLFVPGHKCVDCCNAIYLLEDVEKAKKVLSNLIMRERYRNMQ